MSGSFNGWRFVSAATLRTAAFALFAGGGAAAVDLWSRVHVREFRTGDPASFTERASAWVQRTCVESFGFAALALIAAFVVWATRPRDARVAFGRWWCAAGAATDSSTSSGTPRRWTRWPPRSRHTAYAIPSRT